MSLDLSIKNNYSDIVIYNNSIQPNDTELIDHNKNLMYTQHILPELELKDLLSFRAGSRSFLKLANSQIVRKLPNLKFTYEKERNNDEFIEKTKSFFGEQCSEITTLNLANSKLKNFDFSESFHNLTTVIFKNTKISDSNVEQLLKFEKMQSINLKKTNIKDYKFLEKFKDLREIKTGKISLKQLLELRARSDNGRRIANLILVDMLNKRPSLIEELDIISKANSLMEVIDFFGESKSEIKKLHITYSKFKDFSALSHLKKLESLSIISNSEVTELSALSYCKDLRFLMLYNCQKLSNIDAIYLCKNLENFSVHRCPKVSETVFDSLQYCNKLKKAVFQNCDITRMDAFKHSKLRKLGIQLHLNDYDIFQNYPNLRVLSFGNYAHLDLSSLKNPLHIKMLEFINCKEVDLGTVQHGFEELRLTGSISKLYSGAHLPKTLSFFEWKKIELSFLPNVQSIKNMLFCCCDEIDLESLKDFVNLDSIKFDRCGGNFDITLLNDLLGLRSLEIDSCGGPLESLIPLDFEGFDSITELKISNFDITDSLIFNSFPNLKKLTLSNLKIIELESLKNLELDTLSVSGCDTSDMIPLEVWPCQNLIIDGQNIVDDEV